MARSPKSPARTPKKERVLHTRVPAILEQELRRLADTWRMPVSNVVRSLLEDALDTVDAVGRKAEGELREVANRIATERRRIRKKSHAKIHHTEDGGSEVNSDDALDGAVGFSEIILASKSECAVTGESLQPGNAAYIVHFDDPSRQEVIGKEALPVWLSKKENL